MYRAFLVNDNNILSARLKYLSERIQETRPIDITGFHYCLKLST